LLIDDDFVFMPQPHRPSLWGPALCLVAVLALALVAALPARAAGSGAAPAAAPAAACSAPTAGSFTVSVQSGGIVRQALVHVPAGIPAGTPAPLLLALHGAYGTGPGMETYSGFSSLADTDDFIVAYPNAAGHFWNISGASNQPNDVAFISALISTLESNLCIDSSRVYAAGVSNGAGMVALLGCDLSTHLAGIAAVAGDYDKLPACHLKRPVPLLEIHGTSDRIAPYRGKGAHATVNGLPPFVDEWAGWDGCSGSATSRPIATHTVMFKWKKCSRAATVEHIRIIAGRHQWPGATPPDPGPASTICASCAIWSFFSTLGAQSTSPAPAPPSTTQPPTTGGAPPSGGAQP
jgi:polyhydroxybutyrate depolymerase